MDAPQGFQNCYWNSYGASNLPSIFMNNKRIDVWAFIQEEKKLWRGIRSLQSLKFIKIRNLHTHLDLTGLSLDPLRFLFECDGLLPVSDDSNTESDWLFLTGLSGKRFSILEHGGTNRKSKSNFNS